ncbi:ubiquitin carboxyl-terminal hydrolase domain-containing protein [Trichoderma breve]|uniref:ubiquitinyl hydrolase 1 n=1 Tax=Trichoderma breve TaxID=2034170 RepID=A0A9W9BAS7_9HYPO|nr:ubiquitin carboxyl-terminal hydrolase domain-containing protein [Trichoderma breve]KAJ4856151.1 ubiquitin carboxyl-terminal hydrolase domain-containing protein [Trichoderma breve]
MKEFPRKFLSLRDKSAEHHRSKSAPPANKARPLSAEAFRSIFKPDHAKQTHQNEVDAAREVAKIEDILHRLDQLHIMNITEEHVRDILGTKFVGGDLERAVQFIDIEKKSSSGIIIPYDPSVQMVGAENRSAVTCYIDSLLFAMFSKLDAFECMLKTDFPEDDPRHRLVILLRIWVNMLRTGKLIRTDLTKLIQDSMAECGWPEARLLEQQDASEAFAFFTEKLELPLLSLQVDLFHQGKFDKDDHKIVYERLLNLAVPSDSDEDGTLNSPSQLLIPNQIQLIRDGESTAAPAAMTLSPVEMSPSKPLPDVPLETNKEEKVEEEKLEEEDKEMTADEKVDEKKAEEKKVDEEEGKDKVEEEKDEVRVPSSEQVNGTSQNSTLGETSQSTVVADQSGASSSRMTVRHRSTSVIQRVMLDDRGRPASSENIRKRLSLKGSTVIKAVTIPAWQFFRLIPWHAVSNSTEPRNNVEVAMNLDQRPVVGICLKRYAMTETGLPKRHNTYIDIPESMRLPHFMLADGPHIEEETNGLATEYKLVLQSIVCHRGDSLQSGHYISFARVAPKLLTDNRRHDFDPPPDYEEAQWVRFDDLDIGRRVTFVDDIKESLKVEMPYLLFYQIVPMVDAPCPTESTEGRPPSYDESKKSLEILRSTTSDETPSSSTHGLITHHEHQASASTQALVAHPPHEQPASASTQALVSHHEHKASASTQALATHHEHQASASTGRLGQSKTPSIRLSAEVERPSRKWLEGISMNFGGSYVESVISRRQSVALTDSAIHTPSITPDAGSPAMAPVDEPTASRLSRAASRFNLGKQSRPASQSGEGRISLNLSRFGGLIKTSKEPLPEPPVLNISTANSTGQPSPQPGSPTSLEKQLHHPASSEKQDKPEKVEKAEKQKHKRKKSKEKNEKQKTGDQPERECVVM